MATTLITNHHVQPETDVPEASPAVAPPWKGYQKILFRIAFIFFVIMSIPWSADWYENAFSLDWLHLHYRDLYDVARFQPSFIPRSSGLPTLQGYADWLLVLLVAVIGGLVWTAVDRKRTEYNLIYYWLRAIVRYRAAIGIIGFGFTKLLPVQMPYPSIGLLNTSFGDLTAQKIYWLSVGIVPWYQVFAGVVEISAGVLLLFRRTTFFGAVLLFGALGDIVYVNFAYDGGVHVYSTYFVLFAAFLLVYDTPRLYNLLIRERFTVPVHYYPDFNKWQQALRVGLKTATLVVFVGVLFYLQYVNFRYDPYKQPAMKGVPQLRGYYHVAEFRLNGEVIPESALSPVRWQEVTFEKWTTMTYTVNKPVALDLSNGGGSPMRDINRTFELTGVAGGRRVFYYEADPVNHVLYLQDKNRGAANRENRETNRSSTREQTQTAAVDNWIPSAARAVIGDETTKIDRRGQSTRRVKGVAEEKMLENGSRHKMTLTYQTTDGNQIILTGTDENRDSVYVVLKRMDRKYALSESSLEAGVYE